MGGELRRFQDPKSDLDDCSQFLLCWRRLIEFGRTRVQRTPVCFVKGELDPAKIEATLFRR
jgi:hypothetical protein